MTLARGSFYGGSRARGWPSFVGIEKIVEKPPPPPEQPAGHSCDVPLIYPRDWDKGTTWSCDECGEYWVLNWIDLPWRFVMVSPWVTLLNFGTVGLLMRWGKRGDWRSRTSARAFIGLNITIFFFAIIVSFIGSAF